MGDRRCRPAGSTAERGRDTFHAADSFMVSGQRCNPRFLLQKLGAHRQWRMFSTHANGQPAYILYLANETKDLYEAFGIQVITLYSSRLPGQISEVTIFRNP